ncbi:MAG: hypothetical protein OXC07_05550 [Kistimonas sp.]|nr:hypothetical protein [Kistimonas sp.]
MKTHSTQGAAGYNTLPIHRKQATTSQESVQWRSASGSTQIRTFTPTASFFPKAQQGGSPNVGLHTRQAFNIQPLSYFQNTYASPGQNTQSFLYLPPGCGLMFHDPTGAPGLHHVSLQPGQAMEIPAHVQIHLVPLTSLPIPILPGLSPDAGVNFNGAYSSASTPLDDLNYGLESKQPARRKRGLKKLWNNVKKAFSRRARQADKGAAPDSGKTAIPTAADAKVSWHKAQTAPDVKRPNGNQPPPPYTAQDPLANRPLPSIPSTDGLTSVYASLDEVPNAASATYANVNDLGQPASVSVLYDTPRNAMRASEARDASAIYENTRAARPPSPEAGGYTQVSKQPKTQPTPAQPDTAADALQGSQTQPGGGPDGSPAQVDSIYDTVDESYVDESYVDMRGVLRQPRPKTAQPNQGDSSPTAGAAHQQRTQDNDF